jgi:Ca-activated chloride channel family protein
MTAGQAPTFSSRVEAVRVDVLVTEQGRIVRGLGASDFEIIDNGVRQEVDLVTFERLPLQVILAFDVSDSLAGHRLQHLRASGLTLLDQLAAEDQSAFVRFSHVLSLASRLTRDRAQMRAALENVEASGRTALVDASFAGLLLGEADAGRSLLILFSDGVDTSSWLRPNLVLDTARRSDVVVYCVSTEPSRRAAFASELTSATGGMFLHVESMQDVAATFLRILEEFRQRYLVSYTPRGVAATGWHRLDVRVKGRRATVRARPGYLAGS